MNNGHTGTSHFVLYREVDLSLEVKMYLKCVLYREVLPISIQSVVHHQKFMSEYNYVLITHCSSNPLLHTCMSF